MSSRIFRGSRVFVTGGAGFIDSHAVMALGGSGAGVLVYGNLRQDMLCCALWNALRRRTGRPGVVENGDLFV